MRDERSNIYIILGFPGLMSEPRILELANRLYVAPNFCLGHYWLVIFSVCNDYMSYFIFTTCGFTSSALHSCMLNLDSSIDSGSTEFFMYPPLTEARVFWKLGNFRASQIAFERNLEFTTDPYYFNYYKCNSHPALYSRRSERQLHTKRLLAKESE